MNTPLVQFPNRGPIKSKDFNNFIDLISIQLSEMSEKLDANRLGLRRRRVDENIARGAGVNGNYREKYERLVKLASEAGAIVNTSTTQQQIISFLDSYQIHHVIDDTSGGTNEYPVSNRCILDSVFGQVTLPHNGIKSAFWSASGNVDSETIFTPSVEYTYTEVSPVAADKIDVTNIRNALDGSSLEPYLIRAVYDINTDIEEVIFDLVIQVPQEITREANTLTIEPAPELKTQITNIQYSPNTITPNQTIPNTPLINKNNPLYDTKPIRLLFPKQFFTSLGIRLSSKHWAIENGRKVFYVGLRELGLHLIDWDATWSQPVGAAFNNNGFFIKLEVPKVEGISPDVCYLDTINIRTSPELATAEDASLGTSTGIRVRLFEDDDLATVAADSVGGGFPHTVTIDTEYVWLNIEMDLNNTSGRIPVLEALLADYTLRT